MSGLREESWTLIFAFSLLVYVIWLENTKKTLRRTEALPEKRHILIVFMGNCDTFL